MITGVDGKSIPKELKREKLPDHWRQYFVYEKDIELSDLTKNEFLKIIHEQKKKDKPFLDSQQVISKILTGFGKKHIFHRKFNESHSALRKEQVLGMQLYKILAEDDDLWIYNEIQHADYLYSHATYFISVSEERKTGDKARIISSSSNNGLSLIYFNEIEDFPDDSELDPELEKEFEKLIKEGINLNENEIKDFPDDLELDPEFELFKESINLNMRRKKGKYTLS